MNNLVTLKGVGKSFRRGSETIHALRDINLTIAQGDFAVILGPSGSGKSTLLQVIGCLEKPDSGEATIDGEELHRASERQLTEIRSHKVGFVFQQFFLQPTLTAFENVQVPAIFAKGVKRGERAKQLLEEVGLGHRLHHRPAALSGGEMQRVAIARALINEPRLLLADEPTGSLDAENAGSIMQLFKKLNRNGLTIIMVTHNVDLAPEACRVMRLVCGKLVAT